MSDKITKKKLKEIDAQIDKIMEDKELTAIEKLDLLEGLRDQLLLSIKGSVGPLQ